MSNQVKEATCYHSIDSMTGKTITQCFSLRYIGLQLGVKHKKSRTPVEFVSGSITILSCLVGFKEKNVARATHVAMLS